MSSPVLHRDSVSKHSLSSLFLSNHSVSLLERWYSEYYIRPFVDKAVLLFVLSVLCYLSLYIADDPAWVKKCVISLYGNNTSAEKNPSLFQLVCGIQYLNSSEVQIIQAGENPYGSAIVHWQCCYRGNNVDGHGSPSTLHHYQQRESQ